MQFTVVFFIDLASNGDGIAVGSSMYPAFGKYFMDELTYYYEPNAEKAKELLKEAGYADVSKYELTFVSPTLVQLLSPFAFL